MDLLYSPGSISFVGGGAVGPFHDTGVGDPCVIFRSRVGVGPVTPCETSPPPSTRPTRQECFSLSWISEELEKVKRNLKRRWRVSDKRNWTFYSPGAPSLVYFFVA